MRILVFILSSVLSLCAFSQNYEFYNHNAGNGFKDAYVYTINQDSEGYLWVGTSDGLYRYDGFDFREYTERDSMAGSFVSASLQLDDKMYFGHRNGKISVFSNSEFRPFTLSEEEISSVTDFRLVTKTTYWVSTYENGLFKVSKDKVKSRIRVQNAAFTINSFLTLNDSDFLIGSDDGLRTCTINENGYLVVKEYFSTIPQTRIISLIPVNDFYIVVTEDAGIFKVDLSTDDRNITVLASSNDFDENYITSVAMSSANELWIATMGSGVYRLNCASDDVGALQKMHINVSDFVKTLFIDFENNIWLGNYGEGLTKLVSNPLERTNLRLQNPGAIVAEQKQIFIADENKVIQYNPKGNKLNAFGVANGLPDDKISVLFYKQNYLYVGYSESGLYKISLPGGVVSKLYLSNGLLENNITDIAFFEGAIWAGTKKGLASISIDNQNVTWHSIQTGSLGHNVVVNIYSGNNELYITTRSNILSIYKNKEWRKKEIAVADGAFYLNSVSVDAQQNIWLTSRGSGLFKVVGDSIFNFSERDGLISDYCYSIVRDSGNNMWVSHKNGVSIINSSTYAIQTVKDFGLELLDEEIEVSSLGLLENKSMWITTSKGLFVYSLLGEGFNNPAPRLKLVSIRVNNQLKELGQSLSLRPGKYRIEMSYIGLNLHNPQKTRYQYRLIGYNDEWSEITSARTAVFTNVDAGNYVFEVISASSKGVVNKELLRYKIIVRKPLWSFWWFYPASLLILSIFGFMYVKRREYTLRQHNIELESRVKERTNEILKQKDEIERQGKLLIQKNLDITDSIKYARNIQSAIFPPEDILSEALEDYFLINKPKDIVSGDFCWYTKINNSKYVVAITDCTGHGVPGAIMSMLGITLFNEVVNNMKVTNTSEILELVRSKVILALNQQKKDNPSYDGMNVGLCVIDKSRKTIQYSGAFHNLILVRDGKMEVFKAERTPIGYTLLGSPPFSVYEINYHDGDMFYMYSDGFQDQFGGEFDRKFSNKRLLKNLVLTSHKELDQQKQDLEQTLQDWMQDTEQTDDIILLGFRV